MAMEIAITSHRKGIANVSAIRLNSHPKRMGVGREVEAEYGFKRY